MSAIGSLQEASSTRWTSVPLSAMVRMEGAIEGEVVVVGHHSDHWNRRTDLEDLITTGLYFFVLCL